MTDPGGGGDRWAPAADRWCPSCARVTRHRRPRLRARDAARTPRDDSPRLGDWALGPWTCREHDGGGPDED